MIKLFFRNKAVEIINSIYVNKEVVGFGLLICSLVLMAVFYYIAIVKYAVFASALILFIIGIIGISRELIDWIKHNIQLAKNNIKVELLIGKK